jgi:hypothetical protein
MELIKLQIDSIYRLDVFQIRLNFQLHPTVPAPIAIYD